MVFSCMARSAAWLSGWYNPAMSPSPEVTLFLPGLLPSRALVENIPAAQRPHLKELETLLARAEVSDWGTGDVDTDLFHLFGIEVDVPPVAALTARAEGFDVVEEEEWLRADPVCLVPDRDDLVMVAEAVTLDAAESTQLRETLNAHFAAEGWRLEAVSPGPWFVRLDGPADIATTPPAQVLGRGIRPHLPRGAGAPRWRRALNEAQMLLHDHPVNRQREAEGRPAVNSIWFWGGGALPPRGTTRWDGIHGEGELLRALADYHGIPCAPSAHLLADAQITGKRLLLVSDACARAAQQGDPLAWLEAVAEAQSRWLVPLARRGARLTILPGDGRALRVAGARRGLRRLWPRRRPLERWLAP